MENDKEMSFLARFQVYEMFKVQLKCRLELRKVLHQKPEILDVSVKSNRFKRNGVFLNKKLIIGNVIVEDICDGLRDLVKYLLIN